MSPVRDAIGFLHVCRIWCEKIALHYHSTEMQSLWIWLHKNITTGRTTSWWLIFSASTWKWWEETFLADTQSATYGLIYANAKWNIQSDELLHFILLIRVPVVSQFVYLMRGSGLAAPIAKIVAYIMMTGVTDKVESLIFRVSSKFKVWNSFHRPCRMPSFGVSIVMYTDVTS